MNGYYGTYEGTTALPMTLTVFEVTETELQLQ